METAIYTIGGGEIFSLIFNGIVKLPNLVPRYRVVFRVSYK